MCPRHRGRCLMKVCGWVSGGNGHEEVQSAGQHSSWWWTRRSSPSVRPLASAVPLPWPWLRSLLSYMNLNSKQSWRVPPCLTRTSVSKARYSKPINTFCVWPPKLAPCLHFVLLRDLHLIEFWKPFTVCPYWSPWIWRRFHENEIVSQDVCLSNAHCQNLALSRSARAKGSPY